MDNPRFWLCISSFSILCRFPNFFWPWTSWIFVLTVRPRDKSRNNQWKKWKGSFSRPENQRKGNSGVQLPQPLWYRRPMMWNQTLRLSLQGCDAELVFLDKLGVQHYSSVDSLDDSIVWDRFYFSTAVLYVLSIKGDAHRRPWRNEGQDSDNSGNNPGTENSLPENIVTHTWTTLEYIRLTDQSFRSLTSQPSVFSWTLEHCHTCLVQDLANPQGQHTSILQNHYCRPHSLSGKVVHTRGRDGPDSRDLPSPITLLSVDVLPSPTTTISGGLPRRLFEWLFFPPLSFFGFLFFFTTSPPLGIRGV
jgi:hypothetical protein